MSVAGRRQPATTARGELTRSAILEAAAPLFAEHGYRGASLAQVAKAVGVTQPGLLHHFPSKEHLLLALLDQRYHADGRALGGQAAGLGLELFPALVEIVANNALSPMSVKLFSVLVSESVGTNHPAHGYFVERYRKVRHRMARELRAGQAAGEIRADIDVTSLVPIIVGVMDGLQNQWLLDEEIDMIGSFRLFCDLMQSWLGERTPDGRVAVT